MKKKLILPIAASAALLFTSGGVVNAEASTQNMTVQKKVYFYQSGNIDYNQINSILQKYLKNYQIDWNNISKQNTVQQDDETTKQTTPVQEEATLPAPTTSPKQTTPVLQEPSNTTSGNITATAQVSQFEQEVIDLTNQERAKYGLPALQLDSNLSQVARTKSQDMKNNGYFSHTSPTYGSPFDMMKQFGISYRAAGENIAMGQTTPQQVVNAWMNSEGHRANILNSSYTHIGVGYVSDGNYWTQMFISK